MSQDFTLCVGTVGGGLSCSPDGGATWNRIRNPIPSESNVRALSVYPDNPHRILAGTDVGLFRSDDAGETWAHIESMVAETQIWSVAVDPADSNTIFVGARPDAFRSRDGGKTWDQLSLGVTLPCPIGIPRTTNVIVDPRDRNTIWAGIEVDGVYKSFDGGDTWTHLPDLGPDPFQGDIHGLALRTMPSSAVYATTPFGIATSTDEGESWDYHYFPKFRDSDQRSYCRGVMLKADDPNVIFVGNGDTIPGVTGAIQRSRDGGQTWEALPLPVVPNSVIYWFATHPEVPNVIAAASIYGYVYVSEDGGDSWQKREREFGEIRSLAVMPN
jgi:photosystem II stability/assembly factor-like uncharacterized protein